MIPETADISDKTAKISVQRVKVLKHLTRTTKSGKPITAVRVWKQPFEMDVTSVIH